MKNQPLNPTGGDDNVMTPEPLAKYIINYYNPTGKILDPCRGTGAFYDNYPGVDNDWCELSEGKDFFEYNEQVDWIITNPPFSQIRQFLKHSMTLAADIVFLCPLNHLLGLKARFRDIKYEGFGIKEVLFVDTPAKPWPQSGFQLGAVHLQADYTGDIKLSNL